MVSSLSTLFWICGWNYSNPEQICLSLTISNIMYPWFQWFEICKVFFSLNRSLGNMLILFYHSTSILFQTVSIAVIYDLWQNFNIKKADKQLVSLLVSLFLYLSYFKEYLIFVLRNLFGQKIKNLS